VEKSMNFEELSDDEWMLVSSLVSDEPPIRLNRRGRPRAEPRVVANAVLWILTTGESWSRLPARYPSGPTCRRRFEEWHVSGTLGELVKLLVQRGRSFVYVPEPVQPQTALQSTQAAQAVAAVAEEVVEDDGLPAVYWKSPEAWQAPASTADAPLANPIESMTRQLARLDDALSDAKGPANAAAHSQSHHRAPPAQGAGTVPRQADASLSAPVAKRTVVPDETLETQADAPWTSAAPQAAQIAEWRGYVIYLSVESARNGLYRAAVEILRDDRRMERSGLIGPPFEDCEAARHYAFDWARQWIEREMPDAAGGFSAAADSTGGVKASSVVTRTMPAATTGVSAAVASVSANAAGNVRHAPLHRYTAGVLRSGGEPRDASSGSSAERRAHTPRYRTHLG
jgi:transposase